MFTPTVTAPFRTSTSRPHSYHTLHSVASTTSSPLLSQLRRDEDPAALTNALTCGYVDGAWSSPVTCANDHTCNYYTTPSAAPNFGCCSEGSGCGYVSTCLDYQAVGNANTFNGVALSSSKFLCFSDYPYCSTLVLYGTTSSSKAVQSFLSYACLKESGITATAYQTTMQDTSSSTTSSSASSTAVDSTSSVSVSSSSASSVSTSSQTSMVAEPTAELSSVVPTPTQSASTSSSGDMSQGSQIGIGVGVGIGVAGLLVALVIWLMSRRKTRHTKLDDIQPQRSFSGRYLDPNTGRLVELPDYKFNRSISQNTGKPGWDGVAAFELASTSRPHELPAESR